MNILKFFTHLYGPYTYECFNLTLTFLENLLCIQLFAQYLEKRRYFKSGLAGCILGGWIISCCLAVLYTVQHTLAVRVLCYLALSLLCFISIRICYKEDMFNWLLVWCSGAGAYQIGNKLYPLLQNFMGINDRNTLSLFHSTGTIENWEVLLFFLVRILCFVLLAKLFPPIRAQRHNRSATTRILILSVSTLLLINVLLCIARTYEGESFAMNIIVKILTIVMGLTILLICAGILNQSEQEKQLAILTQLWKQDNTQFESIKANMDTINMKCHNLKHILSHIENKLSETEIASLQEAIQFYDANVKTENEVLDVVLCEKALLCQSKGIHLSCMADGKQVAFLTSVQIYTLFGNIIDNAIEAVEKLPEPESKLISLVLARRNATITIETSNFFSGVIEMENSLPASRKPDAPRHGFGLKSIQHIAEQYGGNVTIRIDDDMFFLTITFPADASRV